MAGINDYDNALDQLLAELTVSDAAQSAISENTCSPYLVFSSSSSAAQCYIQPSKSLYPIAIPLIPAYDGKHLQMLQDALDNTIEYALQPVLIENRAAISTRDRKKERLNWESSRTLAQMPLPARKMKLLPVRDSIIANPFNLTYEYQVIAHSDSNSSQHYVSDSVDRATFLEDYTRGQRAFAKKPCVPGGSSLLPQYYENSVSCKIDLESTSARKEKQNAIALNAAPEDWDMNEDLIELEGAIASDCLRVVEFRQEIEARNGERAGVESVISFSHTGQRSSLLDPYKRIVSDRDRIEAVRREAEDEAHVLALAGNTRHKVLSPSWLADLMDEEEERESVEDTDNSKDLPTECDQNTEIESEDQGLDQVLFSVEEDNEKAHEPQQWTIITSTDVSDFHKRVPNMAMEYSFTLDNWQKQCILHLEYHENVFVAAHTSAGKTVIAEYAISLSQKHMTRAIYTSPIKALSNQKYRDFRAKFGTENVGLITGDVSINSEANCLIMTTEILRSMLYKGADLIRDVEWVIFDEIHYINDSERGVVWEEVIIMLPEHVGMVFLSATTPNHLEFSDWIGRIKQKRIYVASTYKRPVPLQHLLYAGKKLFSIFDADPTKGFLLHNYQAAQAQLKDPKKTDKARPRAAGSISRTHVSGGEQGDWTRFIHLLQEKNLLPAVIFAFNKRLCEESAQKLKNLDLCSNATERSQIHVFVDQSIHERLQGSDRQLPQVVSMKNLLQRGIGVHHGGLLPILKEIVEILFARGLVKVLFATETFAMGVNMPARTVVFNGLRKHDGKSFRDLFPGEYTQMAGRAGRRGLDAVGTVILPCWHENNLPQASLLSSLLTGNALQLTSQFRLTYNMILNLLRVEVLTVEDMMKRSFSEFRAQKQLANQLIPEQIRKLERYKARRQKEFESSYFDLENDGTMIAIRKFHDLQCTKEALELELKRQLLALQDTRKARSALAPGRVVLIHLDKLPRHWPAIILSTKEKSSNAESSSLCITVIFLCPDTFQMPQILENGSEDPKHFVRDRILGQSYAILTIPDSCLTVLTATMAPTNAQDIRSLSITYSPTDLAACVEFLQSYSANTNEEIITLIPSFLDPMQDLKIHSFELNTLYSEYKKVRDDLESHPCILSARTATKGTEKLFQLRCKQALKDVQDLANMATAISECKEMLSSNSLSLFPDFQQRLQLMKRLEYLSSDNVVQVKGRVACEINSCDELLLTEILFENILTDLEPEEIVAILSGLIFQEKSQGAPTLTARLEEAWDQIKLIADSLGVLHLEQRIEMDPTEFAKRALNVSLVEAVYEWARGMSFRAICDLTDVQEGSIVRCITRLGDLCREVRNAARIIGDARLYHKMEIASEAIKRDVVFAASLYVS